MIGRPFDLLTLMQFAWALLAIIGFSLRSKITPPMSRSPTIWMITVAEYTP